MRTKLLFTSLIFLSGCGAFETDKKGQKAGQIDQELTGSWATDCFEQGFIFTNHQRNELTFSAVGDFEKKAIQHVDSACENEALSKTVSGTYDELEAVEGIEGGKAINFTVRDVVLKAHTEEAAQRLNDAQTCGLNNWAVDKPTSVLGMDCGEEFQDGSVIFDVYKLQDDQLWFGQSFLLFDDKDTPEDRPTTLDLNRTYRMQ